MIPAIQRMPWCMIFRDISTHLAKRGQQCMRIATEAAEQAPQRGGELTRRPVVERIHEMVQEYFPQPKRCHNLFTLRRRRPSRRPVMSMTPSARRRREGGAAILCMSISLIQPPLNAGPRHPAPAGIIRPAYVIPAIYSLPRGYYTAWDPPKFPPAAPLLPARSASARGQP